MIPSLYKLLSILYVVIDERDTAQIITRHYRLYRADIKQIMMFYWHKAMARIFNKLLCALRERRDVKCQVHFYGNCKKSIGSRST